MPSSLLFPAGPGRRRAVANACRIAAATLVPVAAAVPERALAEGVLARPIRADAAVDVAPPRRYAGLAIVPPAMATAGRHGHALELARPASRARAEQATAARSISRPAVIRAREGIAAILVLVGALGVAARRRVALRAASA